MGKKGIDWDNAPLGQFPDTVIAKLIGVSYNTVQRARVLRGIEAYTFPERTCLACRRVFTPVKADTVTCSKRCASTRMHALEAGYSEETVPLYYETKMLRQALKEGAKKK